MSTLDADTLATLTPEERAAVENPDPDETAALARIAAGGDDDDEDDDAPAPAAAPAPAPASDTPAAAPAPAAAAPEPTEPPPPTGDAALPGYQAKLPDDYDGQIKSLKDRDAALRQRFKDGEIDIDERDTGLADLSEQREQLLVARAKAEISKEMQQQTAEQQWTATVNRFMGETAKSGGIDYRADAEKAGDLDSFVKMLANNPANAQRTMDWFLSEAHRRVQALHGVAAPAPAPAPADNGKRNGRKPALDAMPKTLAQVPGGDGPGDVGSEFADLDSLPGDDLEAAIARMTPAQRERYARS
jgi:hypothetical protein